LAFVSEKIGSLIAHLVIQTS